MSCGSCRERGTSGGSARLSLAAGRRRAVYRKSGGGADESMRTRENKTVINKSKYKQNFTGRSLISSAESHKDTKLLVELCHVGLGTDKPNMFIETQEGGVTVSEFTDME